MVTKEKVLNFLEHNDFLTLSEAINMGANKMMLSRLVAAGDLYRPFRRIYTLTTDWLTDPLQRYAPACTLYPDAVICGVSALVHYDLTDEIERKIWLAFPQEHRVSNREYRIVYPKGVSYSLGIVRQPVKNREVRIYDMEKTVVDAFKYLPADTAYKILREYLKLKKKDIGKLLNYARQMRKPLDQIVAIFLSEQ